MTGGVITIPPNDPPVKKGTCILRPEAAPTIGAAFGGWGRGDTAWTWGRGGGASGCWGRDVIILAATPCWGRCGGGATAMIDGGGVVATTAKERSP